MMVSGMQIQVDNGLILPFEWPIVKKSLALDASGEDRHKSALVDVRKLAGKHGRKKTFELTKTA